MVDSRKMVKPRASPPPWKPPGSAPPPPPRRPPPPPPHRTPPPPPPPPGHAANARRGEGRSAVRAPAEPKGAGAGGTGRDAEAVAEQEAVGSVAEGGRGRKRWSLPPEPLQLPKRRKTAARRESARDPPEWCKDIAVPLGRNRRDADSSRPRTGGAAAPEKAVAPTRAPLAGSKEGVPLGEALPRTSVPNKVPAAAAGARPTAVAGRHGAGTKSSEALPRSRSNVPAADGLPHAASQGAAGYTGKSRGRGAGTGELQRKDQVPFRSNAGSLLGRGSLQARLPSKDGYADGDFGVSNDTGSSVANQRVVERVLSSEREALEEGKNAFKVHPVEASTRHLANEKTSDNRLQSGEKSQSRVLNKSGRGSCNVLAKSSAQGPRTDHLKGSRVSEFGRKNRVSSDVPARMPNQSTMARNKIVHAPGVPVPQKNNKFVAHPPIKVIYSLGSKENVDSKVAFYLKDDDVLKAAAFCEENLKLYVRNSSDCPSLRRRVNHGVQNADVRRTFKMICRRFEFICRVLVHAVEHNLLNLKGGRIDLTAYRAMKKLPDFSKPDPIVGKLPGVEVGDEFSYRVQLATVGLHRRCRGGIDWTIDPNGTPIAISIVCSGYYPDELSCSGKLIYTGSGGKHAGKKHDEDQHLDGGNLALANSIKTKNPVRVIYGFKNHSAEVHSYSRARKFSTYTYDGLYQVVNSYEEDEKGSMMFKFVLNKIPGQQELPLHIANRMQKSETRRDHDISKGKEGSRIRVINTVDNVLLAPFQYINRIKSEFCATEVRPQGCGCTNGCSDSLRCSCARKNGGKFPFNFSGAIVSESPLIFECGPSCKCPDSCHNRVGQQGIKIPLEVFRTSKSGWGVRCLRSISSGSFVCEYVGKLRHSMEADQRKNSDYLFNIGNSKGSQPQVSGLKSSGTCSGTMDVVGFTVDATVCGNAGRFINRSCSPNLFAQKVLFDHGDKRKPHIMFFAAETIPPLQELTYEYK